MKNVLLATVCLSLVACKSGEPEKVEAAVSASADVSAAPSVASAAPVEVAPVPSGSASAAPVVSASPVVLEKK